MAHRATARRVVVVLLFPCCVASASARAADAPAATRPAASAPSTRPGVVVAQADGGVVELHARDVTIHGTTVRYEPKPEKNTVGYWTKKDDWVSWDFVVTRAGRFDVVALQGCGKGSGGAEVEFTVNGQTLRMTVQDTGHFQNFVPRDIGAVDLPAGPHTLTVKPQTKPGAAVMDLRAVTLTPVERK